MERGGALLVTDFDGTMTQRDFYRQALAMLVPPGTRDYWDDYLAGVMTHFEALAAIFTRIRASEGQVMAAARRMGLDPHAGQAVATLRDAGWEVAVLSAGCAWYIRRLLAEQGVELELHANPGEFDPSRGLLMSLPADSPFLIPTTGIDKVAFVRNALCHYGRVAFAGDGQPDLPAALLVPPDLRFARGWLAEHLSAEGIPFRAFGEWSEIAEMLASQLVVSYAAKRSSVEPACRKLRSEAE